MKRPKAVKCPYFLCRTTGYRLYINCSTENYVNLTSKRIPFDSIEERKACYKNNCCNDYQHCQVYKKLKEGEKE